MSMPPPPPPPGTPPPYGGGYAAPPPPPYASGYPPAPPPYGYAGRDYASFGARLGGLLLDQILYGLLVALFAVPGIILIVQSVDDCDRIGDEIRCTSDQLNAGALAGGIALIVIGALLVGFLYLRALGRTGQTWGRQIVGIRVVRKDDGQPLGFWRAFGRQIVEGVISGNLCFLGYLWMLWDKDKQTWHDKIVDSIVIRA